MAYSSAQELTSWPRNNGKLSTGSMVMWYIAKFTDCPWSREEVRTIWRNESAREDKTNNRWPRSISTRKISSCCAIDKWPGQSGIDHVALSYLFCCSSCPTLHFLSCVGRIADCSVSGSVQYGPSAVLRLLWYPHGLRLSEDNNWRGRIEFMFCGNPFIISGSCPICVRPLERSPIVLLLSCSIIVPRRRGPPEAIWGELRNNRWIADAGRSRVNCAARSGSTTGSAKDLAEAVDR